VYAGAVLGMCALAWHDCIIPGLGQTVPRFEQVCSISWKIVRCLPSGHRSASHQKSRRKKTARRRSVFAREESPCLGQGNSFRALVRASGGSTLPVSIVESGDLVSGPITSPSPSARLGGAPIEQKRPAARDSWSDSPSAFKIGGLIRPAPKAPTHEAAREGSAAQPFGFAPRQHDPPPRPHLLWFLP